MHFDYIIGSAHKNREDVDASEMDYVPQKLDSIAKGYLHEVLLMVQDNQFDCVGHLDLIKRYASRQGRSLSLDAYREQLEEIFKVLINNGKGIEVNTSGLRESMQEFMPDFNIVKFYKELGGEIITLGSDAHKAQDVGEGIKEATNMLREAGFRYVTVYEKGMPNFEPITLRKKYYQLVV